MIKSANNSCDLCLPLPKLKDQLFQKLLQIMSGKSTTVCSAVIEILTGVATVTNGDEA